MFTFKVKPDGGDEFDVTASSRDVYMWEKTGRGRSLSTLSDNPSMTELYSIAHLAARRQQLFTGSLDEFTQSCDVSTDEAPVECGDECPCACHEPDAQPDPTQRDHLRGG